MTLVKVFEKQHYQSTPISHGVRGENLSLFTSISISNSSLEMVFFEFVFTSYGINLSPRLATKMCLQYN